MAISYSDQIDADQRFKAISIYPNFADLSLPRHAVGGAPSSLGPNGISRKLISLPFMLVWNIPALVAVPGVIIAT